MSYKPRKLKPLKERFAARWKFHISGCWLWQGALTDGYGTIRTSGKRGTTSMLYAHRVSFELHRGPVPEGILVLHKCDVRRCVNPAHLFLGTHRDNTQDMIAKGRRGDTRRKIARP